MTLKNYSFFFFYSLFLFLIVIAGCKKEETMDTSVVGSVRDKTNNAPIGFAKVYLMEKKADCWSCWSQGIADHAADANGNFSFSFTAQKDMSYELTALHDLYYEDRAQQGTGIEVGKKNNNKIIFLPPKAWLKVFIKNSSPFDIYDYFSFEHPILYGSVQFYGKNIDTFLIKETYGNKWKYLIWLVKKNANENTFKDSTYCPSFDTTKYFIIY